MSRDEILSKLPSALDEAWLSVDGPLVDELQLRDIEGLESVSRVRLLLAIEELFGIEMTPKEHSDVSTIGQLVTLIETKTKP